MLAATIKANLDENPPHPWPQQTLDVSYVEGTPHHWSSRQLDSDISHHTVGGGCTKPTPETQLSTLQILLGIEIPR
jgi:hypothetical protein